MQQRRGTASQWISTNSGSGPILSAGEIGYESDTNKFKIGDGTNHWIDLDYFVDSNSTVNPSFGTSIVFEGATADSYETTLQVTDPTADRTITLPNASGTVALTSDIAAGTVTETGTQTLTNKSISLGSNTVTSTLAQLNTAISDADVATLAGSETLTNKTLTSPTLTTPNIGVASGTSLTLTGDLTVQGTTTTIDSTTIAVKNAFVFEGATNDAFETTLTVTDPTADRTITLPDATGTVQLRVTDVSDTEIGYLDGVTSAIQTQINAKAPTANAAFTGTFSAPSGTITSDMIANGTIADADINASAAIALSKLATDPLARANHTGSQTASTISDFNEAAQDAIGGILGTGLTYNDASNTITVDSTNIQLRVTGVSDTEIGYLDGVTSAIQTQLDAKSTASKTETLTNKTLTSPVINTPTGITKSDVGLANVDNTTDANKPVSTATQTALDLKLASATAATTYAPIASPTFTGTVSAAALTLSGDLTVNGTTTTINSTTLAVDDKNVVLGDIASPTDTTADGGGITLKGATDKTFNWVDATDAWTSSEDMNLLTGKVYEINGTTVLSGSTLGSGVTGSSLTSVGTITSGTWNGTTIAIANGGTGATTASTAAAALLPAQTSNSGKYLTTDGSGTLSWGTVSGYSAPTIGSTSIASGATVTTIAGLTLTNPTIGNFILGYTTTATAAGTTTLTNSSNNQQVFTGTTTQTVVMPVASTMTVGTRYLIENNSTGNLTVNSSGGNLIATVYPAMSIKVTSILASGTSAASWDAEYVGFNAVTGTGSAVLGTSPTISGLTLTGTLTAGASVGTSGQVLQSTGTGVQWATATSSGGASFSEFMLIGA